MRIPVFATPVSGTTLNMGGKFTEKKYISWVIESCHKAEIYPMVGDTAVDSFLITNLEEFQKQATWILLVRKLCSNLKGAILWKEFFPSSMDGALIEKMSSLSSPS